MVVIEHNLDVMAEADWVLDLGPEGGDAGGKIIAQGAPANVARQVHGHTGRILAQFLAERGVKHESAAHPSSLPLLLKEKGKVEPPLSARERGGGEGRTQINADKTKK